MMLPWRFRRLARICIVTPLEIDIPSDLTFLEDEWLRLPCKITLRLNPSVRILPAPARGVALLGGKRRKRNDCQPQYSRQANDAILMMINNDEFLETAFQIGM